LPNVSSSRLGAYAFLESWLVPQLRCSDREFADFLASPGNVARVEPPVPQVTPKDADALHEGN
jgi:hypothetical protein